MKNIGFAITGSFCTFDKTLAAIRGLTDKGYNVLPILSFAVLNTDTRFFAAADFYSAVRKLTGNEPVASLSAAEPVGPKNLIDILVIAPCTGNTMGKLAGAITDTPVTMVAKAHMRNNKPLVLGISTNDGLGLNMRNLGVLMAAKGVYFIPFGQDDPVNKPKSLIADWGLLEATIADAAEGRQVQPILLR